MFKKALDIVHVVFDHAIELLAFLAESYALWKAVMAYRTPTYNIWVNAWRFGNPTSDPPDSIFLANFTPGRRVTSIDNAHLMPDSRLPVAYLLTPSDSDVIGDVNTNGSPDTVEIDAGSGRYYTVHYVEYVAMGFLNQHKMAVVTMIPGSGPPLPGGDLLLEDGTGLLLEDATNILLE